MTECVMCEKNIRGGSPIVVFTASLFGADGRWTEHIQVDNTCSVECLNELCEFNEDDTESSHCEEGATCDKCNQDFDAGYTLMLGWAKPKSQKRGWHKAITTKQFCSHGCIAQELADESSPLQMEIPKKKPATRKKSRSSGTKKKTTRRRKK
jgi:hypothetical protein